ncbi:DoxX family protein [Microlunatus parietis]|uniref:Putative membrane protein YphA (DoxX/SURF4 family) n=1 Tax=Microlunatus parietis TaxID=682979 RepID=A0A7Y9ICG4_9ACTN|nr:DoxX family protein [Microlunatus parietis]NYE74307.1 putative membrane protein YphA (DoxX/SURF4 family) [Microlunatus parietis]
MATASESSRPRPVTVAGWVLQVLAAAMFLFTAFGKFTGSAVSVETFDAIGAGDWLRYLTAALELLGAVGLLIPPLSGLAALCLSLLMVGAVLAQLAVVGGPWLLPVALLAVVAVIAWIHWPRTMGLIARIRTGAGNQDVQSSRPRAGEQS